MAFAFTSGSADDIMLDFDPIPFTDGVNTGMGTFDSNYFMAPNSNGSSNGMDMLSSLYADGVMPKAPTMTSSIPPTAPMDFSSFNMFNEPFQFQPKSELSEEDILAQPVSMLTEEERKVRRRAQVAKSARKHRNRQKEELAMLRDQVRSLQEQMERMRMNRTEDIKVENEVSTKWEEEQLTQRRKRKKSDKDLLSIETALCDQTSFQNAVQEMWKHSTGSPTLNDKSFRHTLHHLPKDIDERTSRIMRIANSRMETAVSFINSETADKNISYPHFDIKLYANGPDMEIKLVRGKIIDDFNHVEIVNACWNTVLDFSFEVQASLKGLVENEKLMELDENTRYGRLKIPILKLFNENERVSMESLFVVRKQVFDSHAILLWESIDTDELYPNECDQVIRNDEVGV